MTVESRHCDVWGGDHAGEETFDVGEDTGSPVIEDVYAVPFRSSGLKKLTVKVDHGK